MSIKLPSLEQLIDSFLICCMTEGKSQKTIDFYSLNLLRFHRFLKAQKLSTLFEEIGVAEARKFIYYLQNNAIRWEDNPVSLMIGTCPPFLYRDTPGRSRPSGYGFSTKDLWPPTRCPP